MQGACFGPFFTLKHTIFTLKHMALTLKHTGIFTLKHTPRPLYRVTIARFQPLADKRTVPKNKRPTARW
jgi:hypothetical protein